MATLEVHDGRGRVERVRIAPDDPALFGTSPTCTIVLDGAGVAPVHGRIRWQKGRYKVDAGADVDAIEVNGKRVKSSTLYQGDEIRVGSCRIFIISTEDRPATPAIPADDDRTRIQAAPLAFGPPSDLMPAVRPAAVFEAPLPDEPGRSRRSRSRGAEQRSKADPKGAGAEGLAVQPAEARPRGFWSRLASALIRSEEEAPGEGRVLRSPVVIGLAVTLVGIVAASFVLYRIIVKTTAERQYSRAFQSLDDGDYRNAIKQLDHFLAENRGDKRAGKAKVYLALAKVRQFTTSSGASWENAFQAAQAMVSDVGGLDEYRDASVELAEQVIKVVEGLADRARSGADAEVLHMAEEALALEARIADKASENLVGRSRVEAKLAQAREAIRRVEARKRALAEIDAALVAGSAPKVYEARDRLVAIYPDMAADRDLVGRLVRANDLIKKSVSFDPSARPGESGPNPDPLGPPTTLVLRLNPGVPPAAGPVVYALVDGLAYGLDGSTGAPLWQLPVGPSSPFPPRAIAGGEPAALVVDARYDELVRIDGRRGTLVWRQELGEAVTDPPLVLGNQAYQATPSGKLLIIDLVDGSLRGTLNLGRRLARSPVGDESGQHLYMMGDEDVLFVLDRDPPGCASVEYLGHDPGSIGASPTRVGRFLVVPENTGIDAGRLRVFVLDESGVTVKPRQVIPVLGWTWQPPESAGSVLWSASDRGELAAFSIGPYDAPEPFRALGSIGAENRSTGPAFGLARSEREFWLGSGRSGRYDLDGQTGKLAASWTVTQAGPAAAPVQSAARLMVLTQQSAEGPGVALWGIDAQSGSTAWRTTLGAPWPVGVVAGADEGSLQTLGFDGSRITIGGDRLAAGGFVEQPLPRAGTFRLPSEGATWTRAGQATVVVPAPGADHLLVCVDGGKYQRVDLPSPLGARPLAWGPDILVPGADGRIYLINPLTGEPTADPFVPGFDKARAARWLPPVAVDGDAVALADVSGRVHRLVRVEKPRPRLSVTVEVDLGKALTAEPASTGPTLLVATAEGKVRTLAARDLSPIGTVDLDSGRTLGPVAVGRYGFVGDAAGEVLAFGADGRRIWSARFATPVEVAPVIAGRSVLFLTKSGSLVSRDLAAGGSSEQRTLGILPAGPPIVRGDGPALPTGLGSFRMLRPDRPKPVPPNGAR